MSLQVGVSNYQEALKWTQIVERTRTKSTPNLQTSIETRALPSSVTMALLAPERSRLALRSRALLVQKVPREPNMSHVKTSYVKLSSPVTRIPYSLYVLPL